MTLDPEEVPAFLVMVATILAALLLLAFLSLRVSWPFRPTPAEVGHAEAYTAHVGAVMGATFVTAPFVRVTTYEDFVVIAPLLAGPMVLRRSDGVRVKRVEVSEALLGRSKTFLVLEHRVRGVPENLRLLARLPRPLEAALNRSLSASRTGSEPLGKD